MNTAAGADVETAANYIEDLAEITNEGGYTKQQIFGLAEAALYLNKISSRTFVVIEEKSIPGSKLQRTG